MKTRKAFAVFIALVAGVFNSLLLLVYLTSATPISDVSLGDLGQLDASVPEAASPTEPYSVTFPAGEWPWYGGGGILCYYFSSPTIRSCIIEECTGERGGGLYCFQNSSPVVL